MGRNMEGTGKTNRGSTGRRFFPTLREVSMGGNNKSFLSSFRYLCLTFIFMAMVASCGGGGDGSTSGDPTDDGNTTATTDDTTDSSYDSNSLPTPGEDFEYFDIEDYVDADIDPNPTTITFGSVSITGDTDHATSVGNYVTINSPGIYYVTGTTTDGQIKVSTEESGDVWLVLQNASITCPASAPVYIESAERVIIRLEGDNYLADGDSSGALDGNGNEIDAALYSQEDLVICGEGTLNVEAKYNDGIKSKDGLVVDSGTINVTTVDDGIVGKNYISVEDGNILVVAGGDGLKSTNDGDVTQGFIYVADGVIDIDAGGKGSGDAIQVETHIVIGGGTFDLYTAGGSGNTGFDGDLYTAKGLKAPVGVTIYGGIFTIDSADDSIHSNDTIVIYEGDYSLYSGDDAIHSDLAATVNGGIIDVHKCYEGIESMVITINDGEIHVESQDDPINATDGNGGEDTPGVYIYINGGYSYFNCVNADGFDANGAVVMTGGTVIVNGPVSGANGILDYGTFTMSGGTIIGAGTSAMAQAPGGGSSTQNALLLIFDGKDAGTLFHLETSDGTDVITFAPAKDYASVVYSSSALVTGTEYRVFFGGAYTGGSAKDGICTGGTYSGGTEDTDLTFTISTNVTQIGESSDGRGGFPPGG